jgi:23S rRNA pseudouridine2605 synthase
MQSDIPEDTVPASSDAVGSDREDDSVRADDGLATGGAGEPVSTSGPADGTAAEAQRKRRNRRRPRRGRAGREPQGPTAEGGPATTDEEAAPAEPVAVEVERTDPGELFSEVVSGAWDDQAQPPDEAPAPGKRVLAPEPDVPKLQKLLAQSGLGSRRDLEQWIAEGRFAVNGQPAHTGQRVAFGDRITLDGKPVKVRFAPLPARVLAYHKPAGEVVTHDDPQQRPTVFRRLPRLQHGKWQSVGRLDINTEGLLLFTNSGDLANRLMHPRFGVEREYAVRVLGVLDDEQRERLLQGVEIDGQSASFRSIVDGGGEGANHWYRVVITEGRNREVRKLFEAVGLAVSRLIRIRYGSVVLPRGLRRGVWVDLGPEDVKALRAATSAPMPGQSVGSGPERKGPRRGRKGRPDAGGAPVGFAGSESDRDDDVEPTGPIPNPLQQTYDKRAIQQARRVRDIDESGPIPNPLQQTYDKRAMQGERKVRRDLEDESGPIPNPLQQTFDRRFVQGPKGGGSAGGGTAPGGGRGARRGKPGGPKAGAGAAGGQPDPMRTSMGYIGADAFVKAAKGPRGGKGGRRR